MMAKEENEREEVQEPEAVDGKITVDVSEPEDDEDEAAAAEEKPRRGRDKIRKLREGYEGQITQLRREMEELRARSSQPPQPVYIQPQQQQQQTEDPVESEFNGLTAQMDAYIQAISATDPGPQRDKLINQYRETERKRLRLAVKAEAAAAMPQRQDQEGPSVEARMLASEFPDIYGNDAYRNMSLAEYQDLVYNKRKPPGIATAKEACQRIRDRLGLSQKPPAPTNGERSKVAGVPGRAGMNGGGGEMKQFSKFDLRLARGWCDNDKHRDKSDEEKLNIWYREVRKNAEK